MLGRELKEPANNGFSSQSTNYARTSPELPVTWAEYSSWILFSLRQASTASPSQAVETS